MEFMELVSTTAGHAIHVTDDTFFRFSEVLSNKERGYKWFYTVLDDTDTRKINGKIQAVNTKYHDILNLEFKGIPSGIPASVLKRNRRLEKALPILRKLVGKHVVDGYFPVAKIDVLAADLAKTNFPVPRAKRVLTEEETRARAERKAKRQAWLAKRKAEGKA